MNGGFVIYPEWKAQFVTNCIMLSKVKEYGKMAFGNHKFGKKTGGFKKGGFKKGSAAKKNVFNNTNITGLWATKRDNLFVGTLNDLSALIALVKKARDAEKGITFFLWHNDKEDFAEFNLVANVAQDRPDGIKNEEEEETPEEEDADGL